MVKERANEINHSQNTANTQYIFAVIIIACVEILTLRCPEDKDNIMTAWTLEQPDSPSPTPQVHD